VNKLISTTLLIGILAAPVALASVAGCGGQDEQAQVRPTPAPTPPPPPTPEPKPTPGPTTGDPPPAMPN
jgi:hypothetical protein